MKKPLFRRNPTKRLYQLIERGTNTLLDEKDMTRSEALTRNCALFCEYYHNRTAYPQKKLARWEIAQ